MKAFFTLSKGVLHACLPTSVTPRARRYTGRTMPPDPWHPRCGCLVANPAESGFGSECPNTHDVAMISIPRDYWVPITNYGHQKIDVACEVGGIALARGVSSESIHQQVLSAPDFATLGNSPDGRQQVVFPNWTAIRPVIARLVPPSTAGGSEAASNT